MAWRVHDAQYWGVPQRRRRISVVADFGGDTAGEILFERKSVSRHPAESGTARERLAGAAQDGASYAVRIRGGCDGGGKGALVQEDKSGTIGTGNDQTIFCLQGNGIDRADTAGCNGKGWREDTSYTLNTIDRPAVLAWVNNPAIFCLATQQGGAELRMDDRAPALTAAAGMSGNNQPVVAMPINDKATRWQGGGETRNHDGSGNGLGIGKEGDQSPTLTAGDRHGVAYISGVDGYNGDLTGYVASTIGVNCGMSTGRNGVMELSANENGGMAQDSVLCAGFKAGQGAQANGIGYAEECAPTLGAVSSGLNQCPSVLVFDRAQITSQNNRSTVGPDKPCPALHTFGEGQTVCYQMQSFGDYREGDVANSCKQRDFKDGTDLVCAVDCRNFSEGGETNGTLQAKSNGGISYNLQNTVRTGMIVRRLTPMECERLQGFPDGWTDIGEWRDSKGKMRKPSDSPRYKALGNSIALPFWDFLAKRISAQYLRPVTMGSLFDGIGGFPLVFERHNGKGTARWASEIEEFPIAVTKLRFGED